MRPKRFSSIVNCLKVDRLVLAKYPFRMAGRYQTSFLSKMDNGKRVHNKGADGFPETVNWSGQLAWIRANRLPDARNK